MTEVKAELPNLPVLHSRRLPNAVHFPFTAYCHIYDLLAIVTSDWDISVLRIVNGQSAFVIKCKDTNVEITALSWKEDGTCLGVGWNDGTYGIYDGGTGKQLHMVPLRAETGQNHVADWKLDLLPFMPDEDEDENGGSEAQATVLGWMGHEILDGTRREGATRQSTTEEWYDGLQDEDVVQGSALRVAGATVNDLPRAITTLDVTKILPRLSTIPSHGLPLAKGGGSNTKFTTQQSTDSVFASDLEAKVNLVQSLLICQDTGTVQVLLDETVRIGSCHTGAKPFFHSANRHSGAHALLTEAEDGSRSLYVIDLPLQALGGPLLHVIATNTKRMQILLEYVMQTIRCVQHDYETNVVTPSRFLRNLQGDLDDRQDGSDCVSTLFHLAMTGTFHEDLLQWLVDVIKDNNYKRWEQAMNGMYTSIQNHLFINLLPALDRFSIAVTTLRGLAAFHEGSAKFDCPPHLFSNILDKIDSIRLTAQKMQLVLQSEHRQCRAFLKWLRMQIEIGLAEPFSNSALETEEREIPGMDFALILPYIKESMLASKLALHVLNRPDMRGETTKEEFFDHQIIRNMSYERAKNVISTFDPLQPEEGVDRKEVGDPIALINLPALVCALTGHVRVALEQITDWQSRMLTPPSILSLPLYTDTNITDMVMLPTMSYGKHTTKLLALSSSQLDTVSIISCISSECEATHMTFSLETAHILTAKWLFPSDATMSTKPFILTLSKNTDDGTISLIRHDPSTEEAPRTSFSSSSMVTLAQVILHTFPAGISFQPFSILVGGRTGKMVCVVWGNQGREWRTLDLDRRADD